MNDKAQQAADFIKSHCPNVGAFKGNSDPYVFLQQSACDIADSKSSELFPERYKEHVAYAVNVVASNGFLSPPAAVASVYLATRFELYFRVLSGTLNRDGTWASQAGKDHAQRSIKDERLKNRRVSSVSLAYKIMKLGQTKAVTYCDSLDQALYSIPVKTSRGFSISDVGDRIEHGRHAVSHGQLGDISSESVFYGLLTALLFYAEFK